MGEMKERKVGDLVWGGCYFPPSIKQEPMFGKLKPEAPGGSIPVLFEPVEPGKSIPLCLCVIADTRESCIAKYNAQVVKRIKECQEQIEQMNHALIPTLDTKKQEAEEGCFEYLEVQPVWRADLSFNFDAVYGALSNDLVPKEDCDASRILWDTFVEDVENGCLSDYDGFGDLLVDGVASESTVIYIAERAVYIGNEYRIPFGRMPEVFKGHTIEVLWFNK